MSVIGTDYLKSLRKALYILQCFNAERTEMSSAEIARMLGVHNTTAYRMLNVLTEGKFLERNEINGKYRIGPEMYILGSLYLGTTDVLSAADPVIKTINELTNEAVSVAIFDNGNVILIMKEESRYAFRFSDHIGSIIPAYASAMGKAFLSELSEEEVNRLYPEEDFKPLTKNTIKSKTELKRELLLIRETGVSFDPEGSDQGVEGIASLIRNARGVAVAAMAIPAPVFRLSNSYREQLVGLVKMGVSLVSYRLGYAGEENPVRDVNVIRSWWNEAIEIQK